MKLQNTRCPVPTQGQQQLYEFQTCILNERRALARSVVLSDSRVHLFDGRAITSSEWRSMMLRWRDGQRLLPNVATQRANIVEPSAGSKFALNFHARARWAAAESTQMNRLICSACGQQTGDILRWLRENTYSASTNYGIDSIYTRELTAF